MKPPADVLAAVTEATGRQATSWHHFVAGYTHAEKWLVELDGDRAFVKAAANAVARGQIEREAAIIDAVRAPYMPRFYGSAAVGEWAVLVLEDLSGAQWPPPFVDGGEAFLETVARVGSTPPPPGLDRRPDERPYGTYWQRIAADPDPVLANGSFSAAWLEAALSLLDAAESRAELAGDDL